MHRMEFRPKNNAIGEIIAPIAQNAIGIPLSISIDSSTRVSASIDTTADQISTFLAAIPLDITAFWSVWVDGVEQDFASLRNLYALTRRNQGMQLSVDKTWVAANGVDTTTVTVIGDVTATVTLDVFFARSEGDAVAVEVELDAGGWGILVLGPFEVGTAGRVVVCSQKRTMMPYPRVVVEVINA